MNEAIKTLLNTDNEALITFTKQKLLGEEVDVEALWTLPQVEKILKNQRSNGSWIYPNTKAMLRSPTNYNQYQTYKTVAELVEFYGLNKKHEAIRKAAEYLFSFQTGEGEFRGMYGNQYSPNYSASITEFLIKAGYRDLRIKKSLNWLLMLKCRIWTTVGTLRHLSTFSMNLSTAVHRQTNSAHTVICVRRGTISGSRNMDHQMRRWWTEHKGELPDLN